MAESSQLSGLENLDPPEMGHTVFTPFEATVATGNNAMIHHNVRPPLKRPPTASKGIESASIGEPEC